MLVLVREQIAAVDERLQDSEIDLPSGPLALGEDGGILVLLAHDVDLGLAPSGGIVAPPAAKGGELHRGLAAEQQLPEVLLADLLKHLAHILGQMRLDALVDEVRRAARDHGGVLRHEAIPEAEHIVVNGIDRLLRRLLAVGRLFLHDAQRDEVLEIGGTDVGVLAHFAGDLRHAGSAGGDGGDDRRVDRRLPDLLFQKVRRLLVEGGGGVQIGVLDVLLDAKAVVHLQKVLRRPAHDPVGKDLLLGGEVAEIAAGLLKVEGLQLDLRRAPAVERRLVGQHMVLHVGHGRAAEDQHQLGAVLVLVDQQLQRGGQALGCPCHVRILVDGQDDPLVLGEAENGLQRGLEGGKGGLGLDAAGILDDALAEVLQILLRIALDAHEIDGAFALNETVDQRSLADAAASVQNDKLELTGII